MSAVKIQPGFLRGREIGDEIDEVEKKLRPEFPFGMVKGNCILLPKEIVPPRTEEHYMRFSLYKGDAAADVVNRLQSKILSGDTLLVLSGGAVGLADAPVLTNSAAYVLRAPEPWKGFTLGLLAWFKSSFFVWYCAVHLGDPDLYSLLYNSETRLPIPKAESANIYEALGTMANNVILEERNFLEEVHRAKKKGLDSAGIEKLRRRHNKAVDPMCRSIDSEIARFLKLSEEDQDLIAETLRDIKLTDFGYAQQNGTAEHDESGE